jgi:D-glycero-D-manno-heptose 1,7-bisphosphate phosphatase
MRPAVFLDRDGTIIEEVGFLIRPDTLQLFPWSADAIRRLNHAGFAVVVITNQSGVARGLLDPATVVATHELLSARLAEGGATIDRYYFCPHHVDAIDDRYRGPCDCRKPAPGLILQATRDLDLDLSRSWMVGDKWLDVACGVAAGCRGVLVRTGHGAVQAGAPPAEARADAILDNLMEAVGWILGS